MGFTIGDVSGVYDFQTLAGLGYIPNVVPVFKYSYNPDLAMNVQEDVWDFGGTYTWSTTADIDTISSGSALDTQTIVVFGLDSNWDLLQQVVVLDGQNKVTLSKPFIRVYRMRNVDSTDIAGSVYCYVDTAIVAGVPADATKIRAYIDNGNNGTLMSMYTVPRGYKATVLRTPVSMGGRINGFVTVKYWARLFESVFVVQGLVDLATSGSSAVDFNFKITLAFPEKTDFLITAEGTANGLTVGTPLDINLHKDI